MEEKLVKNDMILTPCFLSLTLLEASFKFVIPGCSDSDAFSEGLH